MLNFIKKAKTAYQIIKREPNIVKQSNWTEKKDLTQEEMLSQYKSWAFVCSRLNSESVASSKLRLYAVTSQGQKPIKNYRTKEVNNKQFNKIIKSIPQTKPVETIEEIYDHPVLDLLYSVNDHSNYFDNTQLTQLYLDLAGNAYWYIIKDDDGMPSAIYQMRPDLTEIVPAKNRLIHGYLYGNRDKVALSEDEVIRFYVPNPTNPYYGKSCIEAGQAEVSRNNLYNVYENSQLKNNARPEFIIKYKDGVLTKEEQKRLYLEWNRIYANPNNAGKVKIMDSNFDVETLSFSPKEMQYLQGRLFTKKDIASLFGVPYGLMDTSDQLKAGLDQLIYHYQRYGLLPRLKRIEETLNQQLIPFYDNSGDLFFMFDNPVDDDRKTDSEINTKYVSYGLMSVNEARGEIGYDPVEGGDELMYNGKPFIGIDSSVNQDIG